MLSRVAESIYWMTRYIERAENLARFIDVTHTMMLDQPEDAADPWNALVCVTADEDYFAANYGEANQQSVTQFLTFDATYPHSILSCVTRARENARSIRETISSEMWERLNDCYHDVRRATAPHLRVPSDFFQQVKRHCHLFVGTTDATMSRGEGWHFANLGRLLERADKTSRILDVKSFVLLPESTEIESPADDLQWSAVLESASGFEMYRKEFHTISPRDVIRFLALDSNFPRAIRYCIVESNRSVHAISRTPHGAFQNRAEEELSHLQAKLDYANVDEILTDGLHSFIDSLQQSLNAIGATIASTFFLPRAVAGPY